MTQKGKEISTLTRATAAALRRFEHTMEWSANLSTRWRTHATWRRHNALYRGDNSDLFIVSYPRSGTTLTQMLVHQLLTDGNVEFPHINSVSLFLEQDVLGRLDAQSVGLDSLPQPRRFKSHLPYALIPKGPGRYIYVMRNPLDVAVSFYFHTARVCGYESFEAFARDCLRGGMRGQFQQHQWFNHVSDWRANSHGLDVLFVTYESLTQSLVPTVERIARFCAVEVPASAWPRIMERCSFEFMRKHENKFDDSGIAYADPQNRHFIRRGCIGEGSTRVTGDLKQRFWSECQRSLGSDVPPEWQAAMGVDDTLPLPAPLGSGAAAHSASRHSRH